MTPPIPLEEAQRRLLGLADPLEIETVTTAESLGRYLAAPLVARRAQPPADSSAMDGYALSGDGPWSVLGESRGGAPFPDSLSQGEAIRISTGALIPKGADRVLIQEDASVDGVILSTQGCAPRAGSHIRRKGFDFAVGDMLLPPGSRIGPAQIALALSGGYSALEVHRQPRIALIENGNELAGDPQNCAAHQIPASNNAMIAAMTAPFTSQTRSLGPVEDAMKALLSAFDHSANADVIVTSGGASVGDHDLIRPALEQWGAALDFWRVAIKPGKPLLVARKDGQIILGLPGNPVSSFATAFLFLLPVLRYLSGASVVLPDRLIAKAGRDLPPGGLRREFLRAHWDGERVHLADQQDSSALQALATANALIERPEYCEETKQGTDVPFYHFQNGGIA